MPRVLGAAAKRASFIWPLSHINTSRLSTVVVCIRKNDKLDKLFEFVKHIIFVSSFIFLVLEILRKNNFSNQLKTN